MALLIVYSDQNRGHGYRKKVRSYNKYHNTQSIRATVVPDIFILC